jgi:dGTP triphosphohydrolase
MLMGIAALLLALGSAGWWYSGDIAHRVAIALDHKLSAETERAYMELAKVRAEKRTLERASQDVKSALDAERQRRLALETGTGAKSDKLAHEESARRAAEAAVASLRDELKRKQDALDDAIEAKRISEEKLAVMSAAAAAATQTAKASPEPSTAATGAGDGTAGTAGTAGTSKIETSATRPVANPERTVEVDDAKTAASTKPKSTARPTNRVTQRRKPEGRGSNGFPEYATEMHQAWPYNSWTKRRTNVTQ